MRRGRLVLGILVIAVTAMSAWAAEPPTAPVLRLETGMHTAIINRIGVDAAGKRLVTASDDKTVRLWSLPEGKLLRVLRVPVGAGSEGKVYATAISPDGALIAAGGWTGLDWEGKASIYLFDPASGRMTGRLSGLPNVINHLAFSRDGRYLAAALGGRNGVRVWRTDGWRQVFKDTDYGGSSYWADFDGAGRLATTSTDGFVRLYGPDFKLVAKALPPGGKEPFAAAFSPDGGRIAVGYQDTTRVDVLSGRDLSHLYSPDTADVANGSLSKVAWSADGRVLYAGGRWDDGTGTNPIRRWSAGGRGAYADLAAAQSTVMDIRPLPGGGIAFGTADAVLGGFDATDHKTFSRTPAIADFRGNRRGFLVSHDGSTVRFGLAVGGKRPARFSVMDRELTTDPPADPALAPPVTEAPGLSITGWKNTREPKLNGNPLKLKRYERSRSLAVVPGGGSFLLGTDWSLRLFGRDGKERWRAATPGTAWGVNVAGNGRVAVAALGDGTIRWYRVADGREVLALFPHNDSKRWVAWTPKGYYAASAGGAALIGWHVNRGADKAADFFGASRFRAVFERPDVVERVLETLDEDEALRLADKGRKRKEAEVARLLPPVVTIASPSDGAQVSKPRVTVRYTVRTPSGEPVTGVKVLVDGRAAENARGLALETAGGVDCIARAATARGLKLVIDREAPCAVSVTVPRRDSEVALIAETRFAASEPATVRLRWAGPSEFVIKPKLYALAVGVSAYADPSLRLDFAAKDAADFAAVIRRQKASGLYRDVLVKVLADRRATKGDILDGLDWLLKQTTDKDVAMVFLAGHGLNDANGNYYFLPVGGETKRLRRTSVPYFDFRDVLSSIAGKAVLFVDTCYSGRVIGGKRRGAVEIDRVANDLASAENGVVVFTASTGRQFSLENANWGNGAFTKALVEGLNGRTDYTHDKAVTLNELALYVSERVKALTGGNQSPTTAKPDTVPDFPVALSR